MLFREWGGSRPPACPQPPSCPSRAGDVQHATPHHTSHRIHSIAI